MKFSIITPVYNGEKYLEETIQSVLLQEGDFEIEYIIQDGKSEDKTMEVVKKYDALLKEKKYPLKCKGITFLWFSEKDNGMYDAINKGFRHATGDIYAYINADDFYLPQAFSSVSKVFEKYKDILWAKGITDYLGKGATTPAKGTCFLYNQKWIQRGIYGRNAHFIHQDSVFWKAELWKKSGEIKNTLRYAGDYYLWLQFAKYASLYSVNKEVSCFRTRERQLTEEMTKYRDEQASLSKERGFLNFKIKLFFWAKQRFVKNIYSPFFIFLYGILFQDKQTSYIEFDERNELCIKKTKSYIIP
jgi:glycosyltransferase involved in cell wall biosynthesis